MGRMEQGATKNMRITFVEVFVSLIIIIVLSSIIFMVVDRYAGGKTTTYGIVIDKEYKEAYWETVRRYDNQYERWETTRVYHEEEFWLIISVKSYRDVCDYKCDQQLYLNLKKNDRVEVLISEGILTDSLYIHKAWIEN